MPYIPAEDRPRIDTQVDFLANELATQIVKNFDIITVYKKTFETITRQLKRLCLDSNNYYTDKYHNLTNAIWEVQVKYKYQGAFLGALNYALTRLIQRVPQIKVERKEWAPTDELRYWLYACTITALKQTADDNKFATNGIYGVLEDIIAEYKIRVNQSYEIAQIKKSGDCYDTPYYNKAVPLVDKYLNTIGYFYVNVSREDSTKDLSILDCSVQVR